MTEKVSDWHRLKLAYRSYKRYKTFRFGTKIFGKIWSVVYSPSFDKRNGATRWVLSLGYSPLDRKNDYSMLIQFYHKGFVMNSHTDIDGDNFIWWFLLKKPKTGGELLVDGPVKSYLGGRVKSFNGGTSNHGFDEVGEGGRLSVIFQHAIFKT